MDATLYTRDVPARCLCAWEWAEDSAQWVRVAPAYDCPLDHGNG